MNTDPRVVLATFPWDIIFKDALPPTMPSAMPIARSPIFSISLKIFYKTSHDYYTLLGLSSIIIAQIRCQGQANPSDVCRRFL